MELDEEEKVEEEQGSRSRGLDNYKQAVRTIMMILTHAGYRNVEKHKLADGIHYVITAEHFDRAVEAETDIFYVKWERELFHAAGAVVKGLKGTGTRGASTLNYDLAEQAAGYPTSINCTILFANRAEGKIFAISAREFLEKSVEHTQHITSEVVRCIPIEMLQPWDLGEIYRPQMEQVLRRLQFEEDVLFPTAAELYKQEKEKERKKQKKRGRPTKREEAQQVRRLTDKLYGKEQQQQQQEEKEQNITTTFDKLMQEMSRFRMSDPKYAMLMVAKLAYQMGWNDRDRQEEKE